MRAHPPICANKTRDLIYRMGEVNVIIISLIGSFRLLFNYDDSHVSYLEPKEYVFITSSARWEVINAILFLMLNFHRCISLPYF
jgi:hypothetical protein